MGSIKASVELAIAEANDRKLLPGVRIEAKLLDHGSGDGIDPLKAVQDMAAFIDDPSVVGIVGPYYDPTAEAVIPMANRAGLLLCSPSNESSSLTIGEQSSALTEGADDRAYLRVNAPLDRAGQALARHASLRLAVHRVVVIDGGTAHGASMAAAFADEFRALGGQVVDKFSTPGEVPSVELRGIKADKVQAVMYAGDDAATAASLRNRMDADGLRKVILLGGPELQWASMAEPGSFAQLVVDAGGTPGETYAVTPVRLDFPDETAFRRRLDAAAGVEPGWYGPAGYACAETILEAIEDVAGSGTVTREGVRATATDARFVFDGVFGPTRFDANGDIVPAVSTVWLLDPAYTSGWAWQSQVEVRSP
jgi:branched-chain amino acid transport system substrate-binding protein